MLALVMIRFDSHRLQRLEFHLVVEPAEFALKNQYSYLQKDLLLYCL